MKKLKKIQELFRLPLADSPQCGMAEKLCILLLALCPLLQHYKSFFQDAGTVVLIGLFVYFGIRLLCAEKWRFEAIVPMIIFSAYEMLNHPVGLKELAREMLLLGYFLAAASGVINKRLFTRTAVCIAMTASVLILIQYICYYILGFHLQLVPTWLLDSGAEQWIKLAQTGRISVSGNVMKFYRPSAFFLEPSHLTIYCFPALALVVLSPEFGRRYLPAAVLLSLGITLSTSGMGIALVVGIWGLYLLGRLMGSGSLRERLKKLINPRSLRWIGAGIAALLLVYLLIPTVRMSVNRIFVGTDGGKSAIMGRMGTGIQAVKSLQGWEILFGKEKWGNVAKWNMSGLFYTMYTQGVLGALLSYGFYAVSLLRVKHARFWISGILIGLSLVTVHTHAAFFMMFYVLILLEGYDPERDRLVWNNCFSGKARALCSRLSGLVSGRKPERNA